jgi:proteic killer suppression protein
MIRSFNDSDTKTVFNRGRAKKLPPEIHSRAKRKLNLIDAADSLGELKVPPGNKLERLTGNRLGQHSIRINRQWRICFEWHDGDAYDVEITDYHW